MNPSIRTTRSTFFVAMITGLVLACGFPLAFAGAGRQQAFLAHLRSTERAVATSQAKLEDLSKGIIGQSHAVEAHTASLAASSAALSDADVAELSASGSDVPERLAAVSEQISGLLADPRLAQILSPHRLSQVRADLNASLTSLRLVTAEVNPSLVLWNTLGSAAELGSSAAGGPGTLTIAGAGFVAGRFGGGVLIPPDRGDQSEQLRFGDYSITPDGTIELWFRQDGYNTVSGQPDDGRFHSFWSPDTYPTVRGAAVYTYQVPGEGWHFDIWDGTNGVRNTVAPDIVAGEWHHVAFTWSSAGSYTEVYLDGVLLNRVEQTLNIAAPLYLPMQFGFDWDANDRGATSVLDNLKIWSTARTDFSDRFSG